MAKADLFDRTTWLFAEIDEAMITAVDINVRLSMARSARDKAMTMQLYSELAEVLRQTHAMTVWADEQFQQG